MVILLVARYIDRSRFRCVLQIQEDGPLGEQFRQLGWDVIFLPLPAWRKFKNFFSRYAAVKRLSGIIQEQKIDIIHCNNYRLNPYACSAARASRIPMLTHLHDLLGEKHIRGFSLPKASCLLAVSKYTAGPFKNYTMPVKVVYNGIPTEDFSTAIPVLRKELGFTADKQLIGIVGTFTEKKRHSLFLKIAARIRTLMPEARFIIVGDDVWNTTVAKKNLEQQVKDLRLEQDVFFVGWRKDIPDVMRSLDALLLPSTSEPFPLVVLEAMAAGTIVFAHKACGGPAEAMVDGREGFLVDCEDTPACAQKVVEVLGNPQKCADVRQAGREKVKQRFDIAMFIKNIENLYSELMS